MLKGGIFLIWQNSNKNHGEMAGYYTTERNMQAMIIIKHILEERGKKSLLEQETQSEGRYKSACRMSESLFLTRTHTCILI